jgi:NTE family protein
MTPRHIDLALQGGGTQGAFTWGVLDRLLEDERLQMAAISGTSAGAMNAVVLASGWASGGRRGAREALRSFWSRVADGLHLGRWVDAWLGWGLAGGAAGVPGAGLGPLQMAWDMASTLLAPAHADPAVHNPLHAILRDTVDFDAVRHCRDLKLFVAATHVRSGRQRVWRRGEIGIESVLASACLPTLFPAVEVDGEAYWDGGYMGNPALLPLLAETPTLDLMLVQVHPSARAELPLGSAAVLDRINEITFHGSLVKELRSLAILRKLIQDEGLLGRPFHEPLFRKAAALRVHRIEGGEKLDALAAPGLVDSTWHRLLALHRAGHEAADTWLTDHFTHLGRHGTVDLVAEFLEGDVLNGRGNGRPHAAAALPRPPG